MNAVKPSHNIIQVTVYLSSVWSGECHKTFTIWLVSFTVMIMLFLHWTRKQWVPTSVSDGEPSPCEDPSKILYGWSYLIEILVKEKRQHHSEGNLGLWSFTRLVRSKSACHYLQQKRGRDWSHYCHIQLFRECLLFVCFVLFICAIMVATAGDL